MILMFIQLSNCLFSDGLFDGTMLLVILLSLSETSSHLYLVIRLPGALVTSPIKYHSTASNCDIIVPLPGNKAAWDSCDLSNQVSLCSLQL